MATKNKESKINQERQTDQGRERHINKKKPIGTINAQVHAFVWVKNFN